MKILTLLCSLLFLSSSYALTYRAECIGNGGKAAVSLYSSENKLFMRYSNSRGALDFPFYEGSVTLATLPFIKIAEKELSSIDQEVQLFWPLDKCTFNEANPLLMTCNGPATFLLPENSKLQSYTLITAMDREESLSYSYSIFKIRWGIEGEDFHHSIMLPFDPKNCQSEYKK